MGEAVLDARRELQKRVSPLLVQTLHDLGAATTKNWQFNEQRIEVLPSRSSAASAVVARIVDDDCSAVRDINLRTDNTSTSSTTVHMKASALCETNGMAHDAQYQLAVEAIRYARLTEARCPTMPLSLSTARRMFLCSQCVPTLCGYRGERHCDECRVAASCSRRWPTSNSGRRLNTEDQLPIVYELAEDLSTEVEFTIPIVPPAYYFPLAYRTTTSQLIETS